MTNNTIIVTNRQALHDFHIEKTYEAGIVLCGNEVKSLREGKANLKGSFAKVENGEIYLYNMHINPYEFSCSEIDPLRKRKLLLHKAQIRQLIVHLEQKGYALVPLKVYFKKEYAKVEIGLGKGKKLYDKRKELKEKEAQREIDKAMRHREKY